MLIALIFYVLAYLVGALSSAIVVCKLARLPDPRTQGSGNPGASNVLRIGGKGLASVVFLFDVFKGWLPVMAASFFQLPTSTLAWVGFFAFLGHLFPIFFNFRGGKGVATSLGVLSALIWPMALLAFAVWITVLMFFRIISLASIFAALAVFFYILYRLPVSIYFPILGMCILLLGCHRGNIKRLLSGEEPRLTLKKTSARKL